MTVTADIRPYDTIPRVLLRFVIMAIAVEGVSRYSEKAADLIVFAILASVAVSRRDEFAAFLRFLKFETGG